MGSTRRLRSLLSSCCPPPWASQNSPGGGLLIFLSPGDPPKFDSFFNVAFESIQGSKSDDPGPPRPPKGCQNPPKVMPRPFKNAFRNGERNFSVSGPSRTLQNLKNPKENPKEKTCRNLENLWRWTLKGHPNPFKMSLFCYTRTPKSRKSHVPHQCWEKESPETIPKREMLPKSFPKASPNITQN